MNLDDFMGQTNDQNFDSRHLCEALHEQRDRLAPLLTRHCGQLTAHPVEHARS